MLEVRERRAEPAQQARQPPGHADLLAPGAELDRPRCPRGTSRGAGSTAANRSPAAGRPGQRAEQVLDVGLVPGTAAAEHVGVDDDQRRRSCAPPAKVDRRRRASHVNARARSRPSGAELVAPRDRASIPAAIDSDVERVDEHGRAAGHLLRRAARVVTTGAPQAIASSTGIPKPSYSDG